jgi:U6 snRNA phosphodiesterase
VSEQPSPFHQRGQFRDHNPPLLTKRKCSYSIRIIPGRLDWVSNHEHTRWFLVLRLQKPEDNSLNRLLHISNQSLAIFDQPPLYANIPTMNIIDKSVQHVPRPRSDYRHGRASKGPRPSKNGLQDYSDCFHISLAWSLSQPSRTDTQILQTLEVTQLKDIKTTFESVKVKIGNHVSNMVFSSTPG